MRGLSLGIAAGLLAGLSPFEAAGQNAPDDCIQQGLRPGSAAYHACLSAMPDTMPALSDPLSPDAPEDPTDAQGDTASAPSPDTPPPALVPRAPTRPGSGRAGWNWSRAEK